jgi:hypothetical protein
LCHTPLIGASRNQGLELKMSSHSARITGEPAIRHIPRSWFSASNHSTTMGFLQDREDFRRLAPLAEGERQLGWFVLPPFQRPPVWSREQQSRFIESAWMGLPLGVFIYNRTPSLDGRFDAWLLDGQQRVTAVIAYMADEFPVYGKLFSELTQADHRNWSMTTVFPCLETHLEDEAHLRDVYDRLAYGGTPHDPNARGL